MESSTGLQVVSSQGNNVYPSSSVANSAVFSTENPEIPADFEGSSSASQRLALLVVSSIDDSEAADVGIDLTSQYKSLSISAQKIVAQLNELLQGKLPNGIEGLAPEDVTPERTATTIVQGITSLYSAYVKSNPDLSPEEALTRFMESARKGVDEGYSSAFDTLKGLGAFEFDGVQSGIEQTKTLIEQKLKEFETAQREAFGEEDSVAAGTKESVTTAVLAQAGATTAAQSSGLSLNVLA